jgi:hypothetical protein
VTPATELFGAGETDRDSADDDGDDLRQVPVTLGLGPDGLTVAPVGDRWNRVPTLVGWADLVELSADGTVTLGDSSERQLLRVVVGGTSRGPTEVRNFAVAAPELAAPFATMAGHRAGRAWAGPTVARPGRLQPARLLREAGAAAATWAVLLGGAVSVLVGRGRGRLVAWGLVGRGRHGAGGPRPVGAVLAGLLVVAVVAGGATASLGGSASGAPRHRTVTRVPTATGNDVQATEAPKTADLPAASAAPAPAPPSLAGSAPLQSHEVFGYAPYWTLPESSGFDVQDLTTLAYFSVDANADGSLDQSGPGWNGYQSQDLADLVSRSHAAGDRVVLTVTCFDQSTLDQITSDPTAPATLSTALVAAVGAKNLDGVNFDFEGAGTADRSGLTNLITTVSDALHAANPHWQVTMATYASAAADAGSFYDVKALAPALDGFFVMAYDMNDPVNPSPTAPLVGGGYNDTETLQQYTAVMPASKVILGVPYYGYDWPTTDGTATAQSTGPETPLSYATIAAAHNPEYWDTSTDTAWTSYQVGAQWHETYFDDPTSLAMKAELANVFHIRGLGIWALGMDGNDPAMLAALVGNAPVTKDFTPAPTSTSTSPTTTIPGTAGAGFTSTGQWQGQTVALTPVTPVTTGGTFVGTLGGFTTTDPTLACLQSGPELDVWALPGSPGTYEVLAIQPGDCATAAWTFPVPTSSPTTTTTTTTTTAPTTTTTTTAPTTTTTTTAPPPTTTSSTAAGGHSGAATGPPGASSGGG